ncbi:MAG: flavin reductase family protein [Pirellula sp.]|jgi:flavin reductase (DIM6/NTAB) family NADH-FMN oxidoreductase RutF|nr:flavin reductase family protein [Pirellula sp.]
MEFDFRNISAQNRYKLLVSLIVPRPIAWVSTCNLNGSINIAPFSFFNAIGSDPALVVMGIGDHPDRPKDTAINIERTREFVVNLVPESLAQAMSDSATDFPPDISEVEELGLQTARSLCVTPPRIVGSPAALECKLERVLTIGQNRVVFGEVVSAWVDDRFVLNPEKAYIDTNAFKLIGRMSGLGGYASTRDTFQIERKKLGG